MKNIKKIILSSVVLTLLMMLSGFSITAFASSEFISVPGIVGGQVKFDSTTGTIVETERTITIADIPSEINGVQVTKIGEHAFVSNNNLTKIVIPEGVTTIADVAIIDNDNLTELIIPNTVTEIGDNALNANPALTQITIPNSVTRIGDEAFSSNYSLKEITIPESVVFLGDSVFRACTTLESVNILAELTNIPDGTFSDCSSIKEIILPDTIVSIGSSAFNGCESLENISIPEGVTSIESGAFMYCTSLSSVVLPSTLTGRLESTFWYCSSLTDVNIPEGVTELYYTFSDCVSLTEIVLPMSLRSLESDAFRNSGIVEIEIPPSVIDLRPDAFGDCIALTKVTINEGIENIDFLAFRDSTNLKEIVIPKSVEYIRSVDRLEFPNLTDVYYGGSEQDWQEFYDDNGGFDNDDFLSATFHFDHPMKVFETENDTADENTNEDENGTEDMPNEQSGENDNNDLQSDETEEVVVETDTNVGDSLSLVLIGGIVIFVLCAGIGVYFIVKKKNSIVALTIVIIGVGILVVAYILQPASDVVDNYTADVRGEVSEGVSEEVSYNEDEVRNVSTDEMSEVELEAFNYLVNTDWQSESVKDNGEVQIENEDISINFNDDFTFTYTDSEGDFEGEWSIDSYNEEHDELWYVLIIRGEEFIATLNMNDPTFTFLRCSERDYQLEFKADLSALYNELLAGTILSYTDMTNADQIKYPDQYIFEFFENGEILRTINGIQEKGSYIVKDLFERIEQWDDGSEVEVLDLNVSLSFLENEILEADTWVEIVYHNGELAYLGTTDKTGNWLMFSPVTYNLSDVVWELNKVLYPDGSYDYKVLDNIRVMGGVDVHEDSKMLFDREICFSSGTEGKFIDAQIIYPYKLEITSEFDSFTLDTDISTIKLYDNFDLYGIGEIDYVITGDFFSQYNSDGRNTANVRIRREPDLNGYYDVNMYITTDSREFMYRVQFVNRGQ